MDTSVAFTRSWSIQDALDQHRGLTQQHDLLDEIGGNRRLLRRTKLAFARLEVRDAVAAAKRLREASQGGVQPPVSKSAIRAAVARLDQAVKTAARMTSLCEMEDAMIVSKKEPAERKIQDSIQELRFLKEAIDDRKTPVTDSVVSGELPGGEQRRPKTKWKYVCNCKVGGHGARFCSYLLKRPDWRVYPCENWFISKDRGQCYCPLGAQKVDFTDETHFSRISMHIKGRMWLEDKCKLWDFCPDLMPKTFVVENKKWRGEEPVDTPENAGLPWFVKETDRNFGTSVVACLKASECMSLVISEAVYVVQQHIARPLHYDDGRKLHIKFYNLLIGREDGQTWDLYCYKGGYLCLTPTKWDPEDTSKDGQVTIIRTQRIDGWKHWDWAYPKCKKAIATCIDRAVSSGKLEGRSKKQFEIISSDFLVDTDFNVFLLEFNTGPVLKDPEDSPEVHDGGMIDGALHLVEPWEHGNMDRWDHALTAVGAPMSPEEDPEQQQQPQRQLPQQLPSVSLARSAPLANGIATGDSGFDASLSAATSGSSTTGTLLTAA